MSLTPLKFGIFVNSRNGSEVSLKFGINLAQYVAIPRKLLTPLVVVGGLAFLMASTSLWSGEIPCPENTPQKCDALLLNSLFLV